LIGRRDHPGKIRGGRLSGKLGKPRSSTLQYCSTFTLNQISNISTPYGPGVRYVSNTADPEPWCCQIKATMAKDNDHVIIGHTYDWTFRLMLPSSGNPDGFPQNWTAGVLFESAHTSNASGHGISLATLGTPGADPRGVFRYFIWIGPGFCCQSYDFVTETEIIEKDRWYKFRFQVRYSTGNDGFLRIWRDDVLKVERLNFPTVEPNYGGLSPQVGYYSGDMLNNEVQFGPMLLNVD
jgi:hypothetical protein